MLLTAGVTGLTAGLFIGAALKDQYPLWVVALIAFTTSFTYTVALSYTLIDSIL